MRNLKLLVADSLQKNLNRNIQIVQKNKKVEIVGVTNNGEQEYEMIFELKPDIVITDNQVSKLSGTELIKRIENSDMAYIPKFILIIDGNDKISDYKNSNFAIVRKIKKPVEEDILLDTVEEMINIIKLETPEM